MVAFKSHVTYRPRVEFRSFSVSKHACDVCGETVDVTAHSLTSRAISEIGFNHLRLLTSEVADAGMSVFTCWFCEKKCLGLYYVRLKRFAYLRN